MEETRYNYLKSASEMLSTPITEIPCLWKPFIPSQGIVGITGSSDVGKSSFLRQLGIAVATRQETFLEYPLNVRHGRVIYFSTEDGETSTKVMLNKQIAGVAEVSQLDGLKYIFNHQEPFRVIKEQLEAEPTDLLIIDAFSDVFVSNPNSLTDTRAFLNKYCQLANQNDCAIIFLHHNGKRTELQGANKNNINGSQGFEAKVRLIMELQKLGDGNTRVLNFTKGNYLSDSIKKRPLQLNFNENQQFSLITTSEASVASGSVLRLFPKNYKEEIVEKAKALRDSGMSLDKTLEELAKTQEGKLPSKGTLVNWLKK